MINEQLRYYRAKRGVSQARVSISLGISRNTYAQWENARAEPNIAMLIKISSYFRVTVDEFLNPLKTQTTIQR